MKQAIELEPRSALAHSRLGQVYEQMGRYTEALAIYDKAGILRGDPPDNPPFLATLARVYARMGKQSEAKRLLEGVKNQPRLVLVASAYAALGDREEAFRLLFGMVEKREDLIFSVKTDPQFASLHTDPRWKALLRRMNLPVE